MEIQSICIGCGKVETMISDNLIRKDVCTESGDNIRVMYWKCPQCETINVVQIDDRHTRADYQMAKTIMLRAMRKRMKKETVSPKDKKRYEKLERRLKAGRAELEKKYSGQKLYEESGKIFIESLTVQK